MTARRIRFCQLYAEGYSAIDAAIRAGYSEGSAASNAYRLLKDPDVNQLLKEANLTRISREQDMIEKLYFELRYILDGCAPSEGQRIRATGQMLQLLKLIKRERPKNQHIEEVQPLPALAEVSKDDTQPQMEQTSVLPVPLPCDSVEAPNPTPATDFSSKPTFSQSIRAAYKQQNREKTSQKTIKNHHFRKQSLQAA